MQIKCVRCGLLVLESQARGWCPRCGGPLAAEITPVLQPVCAPPRLDRPTDRSNLPVPPRLPLSVGNPNAPLPASSTIDERTLGNGARSASTPIPRRSKFEHSISVLSVAVRILAFLNKHGGMGKRQLKQRMHSWLFPHWEQAFAKLLDRGLIRLDRQEGRRRHCLVVFLTPAKVPLEFRPRIKPKRRKRRRPRTEWFEEHLPEFQARDRERQRYLDS